MILNGVPLNLAVIIRELTGLYPIKAFLAFLLNRNPTRFAWIFSSPDHIKSPVIVSPFPVHLISETPIISYLKRFSSFLSRFSFPVSHRVLTFHVPIVKTSFLNFVPLVLVIMLFGFGFLVVETFRLCPGYPTEDADLVYPGDVRAGMD